MPRGGFREGAGRPTLFEGATERVTVSLTEEAVERSTKIVDALEAAHPDMKISVSNAHVYALLNVELPQPRRSGRARRAGRK